MFTICTLIYELFIFFCFLYIIIWIVPKKYIIYIFMLLILDITIFCILLHKNSQCNQKDNINNNNNTVFNNTILNNYKPGHLKKID